jgi:SsrA-binding protein
VSAASKHNKERYKEFRNAKVERDYFIEESLEAGIVLTGTEVKSVRQGQVQLNDSYVRMDRGKPTLYQAHIAEYAFGNFANHDPYRPRRLLMNRKEIDRLEFATKASGRTLVPVKMYFKDGLVKIQVALCIGKKQYDKREDMKKKVELMEAKRAISERMR